MNVSLISRRTRNARLFIILLAVLASASIGRLSAIAQVPSTPAPHTEPSKQQTEGTSQKQQTKRILGIIPNFRAVSAGTTLPPQSAKEKFLTATQDSFDYSAIFIPAAIAGYSMGKDAVPELHQGVKGYGRYLWRAGLDQTSENYMVEFVMPVVFRQDNRYYTLGHGGFFKRTGYAISRVVITRSDAATEQFNVSEVLGAGVAAAISTTYYPPSQRNFSSVAQTWGVSTGIDALSFITKEFWPDINHHLFHGSRPENLTASVPQR